MAEIGSLLKRKYRITGLIGQGGMSMVYQGTDETNGKACAVKEIRKDATLNYGSVRNGLFTGAEILKKLRNPHLPQVLDVFEGDDSFIVVMDYIEGVSLSAALEKHGTLPQDQVIGWAIELCDVLTYLHTRKPPVIYRDLKPGNIMLQPDGNIVLIDFGTAREYKEMNRADTVCFGTAGYAAPEQFGGMGQTDARTDIYNLGATLTNLLTGRNPAKQPGQLRPAREADPSMSPRLFRIIEKALQKNPDERYQSAEEMRRALQKLMEECEPVISKYLPQGDAEITIGSSLDCDIRYRMSAAPAVFAVLSCQGGRFSLRRSGENRISVNGEPVRERMLQPGDCIDILELRIVIGKNLIAVSHPDGAISVGGRLKPFIRQKLIPPAAEEEPEFPEPDYFCRSPRFKRDIETAEFHIDPPPESPIGEEMPWILVMGSSMAMGMMSLVTLSNAVAQHSASSMVMGGSMLLGTLFLPAITKKYERNRRRKKEELRQKKYREYLDRISLQIADVSELQAQILRENMIGTAECERRILNRSRDLWERTMGQNDFLKLRVGIGETGLQAAFSYQERRFTIDDDYLEEELYALVSRPKTLKNVPIGISLREDPVSGVIGASEEVLQFAKGLVLQLAALYSYDELKMVFLYESKDRNELDFVRWLPHCWADDRSIRFLFMNANEDREVSAYLMHVIEERKALNETELSFVKPWYVVFSASRKLSDRFDVMKEILALKQDVHFSVVAFYENLRELPRECSMVIDLSGAHGRLFDQNDITGKSIDFVPDIEPTRDPRELAVKLANTPLDTPSARFLLPRTITFLTMFGAGKADQLNSPLRWKENDPTQSLQVPVGINMLGEPFMLDLHEKYHGPHGLIAGMTGSGKSEFIITFILSLAVSYHPYEAAFVLIDYKGGGMAKSFEKLPHTAGIITNLDGASIRRSLVSIESELRRRQAIFAEAAKRLRVSNPDIYKYQKLYREGMVSEPLPHLFIIADEFAELKTQQPEFMAQLISAARIGRSLGVHLILATQKPSGIVDDQIWSNSKFRICLKVQERADSMDMLRRPDAAELVETGRFYLQVGYNELFEMGQSAWAGAEYVPSDRVQKEKDDSVVVVNRTGRPLREVKLRKKLYSGDGRKQIEAVTEYLQRIAEKEQIRIRPLWLPPLPPLILLSDIREKYKAVSERFVLNPVIGAYDDPKNQAQHILRLPLSEEGNAIVYGTAGAGKTDFLNVLMVSLCVEHTPEEVNIYILDFGDETLRAFSDAPQVGDVILSCEAEKIGSLFRMLKEEAVRRKRLFSDYGGDYRSYIRSSGRTLPSIVVAVSNAAAFSESFPEEEDAVIQLSREGMKYGIFFVLTSPGTGSLRFRLLQYFSQSFVLQLHDESEYAAVLGRTEGLYPSGYKGRGLVRKKELYEFQTARLTETDPSFEWIRTFSKTAAKTWKGAAAPKVPVLPEKVEIGFLKPHLDPIRPLRLPVGVAQNSYAVHLISFDRRYISLILSEGTEYSGFLQKFCEMIGTLMQVPGVILDAADASGRRLFAGHPAENIGSLKLVRRSADCEQAVSELFQELLYRHNTVQEAMEAGQHCEIFPLKLVVIRSLSSLQEILSAEGREKLSLILEKGRAEYSLHLILSDRQKNLSAMAYEKWFKESVSPSDGLWIGPGITEQYLLKPQKITPEMREDISSQFGWSIQKGKAVLIKLLSDPEEEEDES